MPGLQDRLAHEEDEKSEQQPNFASQEWPVDHIVPHQICQCLLSAQCLRREAVLQGQSASNQMLPATNANHATSTQCTTITGSCSWQIHCVAPANCPSASTKRCLRKMFTRLCPPTTNRERHTSRSSKTSSKLGASFARTCRVICASVNLKMKPAP